MKKESFVNKISIYIGVTLVLLIWLLTAYTVSSFLLLKESEESSVWSTIQIYMKQIDSKFIAMDQCVEGIAGNQDLMPFILKYVRESSLQRWTPMMKLV